MQSPPAKRLAASEAGRSRDSYAVEVLWTRLNGQVAFADWTQPDSWRLGFFVRVIYDPLSLEYAVFTYTDDDVTSGGAPHEFDAPPVAEQRVTYGNEALVR